jgi:glycosyltransferase involved in cell wall biosynthesis
VKAEGKMEIVYLVKDHDAAALEGWSPLAREVSRLGYHVRLEPGWNLRSLASELEQQPAAVLHCIGWPPGDLEPIVALKSRRPFSLILEVPRQQASWWSRVLGRRAARRWSGPGGNPAIAGFVARSRSGRRLIEKVFGADPSRVLCLSLGVDAEHFQFHPEARGWWRERLGLGHWETLCLQLGPFHSQAEVEMIFAAGGHMLREGRALLALVGNGPWTWRELVRERARRLGVLHRVKFLGEIPSRDLPGLYSAGDLGFALEADPALMAAAMACRLPLLPSAEGALAWWRERSLGSEARVEVGSGNGLRRQLTRLVLEPSQRRRQGEAARCFIEAECAWSAQAEKMCRWYRELAVMPAAGEMEEREERLAA